MLRLTNLRNQFQKRTLRVLYGQTQAYPWAGTLDPLLRNTDGSFRQPLSGENQNGMGARTANAFTFLGGLVPGQVMTKGAGEGFLVHNGLTVRPAGLLGQFVGGELDDLKDNNEIGVWRGPDSLVELLYPAFDDTGLATAYASATAGAPVTMKVQPDGRLGSAGSGATVGYLVERRSAGVIVVELAI
jgi:hypothetical protein